ncbi:hypothetical protein [Dubosiella newyorkensis]|uniref:hypothetical protein n=1 Tax=Dubosiella newyorkensis TaxID=1862672 RepID=UPI003F67403D
MKLRRCFDRYRCSSYVPTGIAGFSHVVDSLSAIKYAKVKTIRTRMDCHRLRDRSDFPLMETMTIGG